MLKAVYPKIKEASPTAQVVIGSLLLPKDPEQAPKGWVHPEVDYNDYEIYWPYSDQSKFFEGILRECGMVDCFDFVNFNGYAFFDNLDSTGIQLEQNVWYWKDRGGQVEGKLNFLNEKMAEAVAEFGISYKPIIQAETGLPLPNLTLWNSWDSTQRATYEAAKADYLVYLYTHNIAKGLAGTTWYHFSKYGWNRGGLLDNNNQPLPAYEAYQVMTKTLTGAVFQTELSLGEGIYGYEFMKGGYRIWVLFSEDGTEKTIAKPPWFSHAYNLLKFDVKQTGTTISFDRSIYIDNIPNTAPIFLRNPLTMAIAGKPYIYNIITGYTPPENFDVHIITAISGLPSWLTFQDHGDGTATLFGTPRYEDIGKFDIELLVTDRGGLTARQKFIIQVFRPEDIQNLYLPIISR